VTGTVRWKYKLTKGVPDGRGVPTDIVGLGSSVYGVAFGDELLCLDLKTGRLNWSFQSEFSRSEFQWSNAPAVARGRVFFGGVDGNVYALDAQTGKTVWKRTLGSRISTHLKVADNSLYLGAADNHIYRINPDTGSVVASFAVSATPVGTITHTGKSLTVFLNPKGGAGGAEAIVCLDQELTKVQWSQNVAEGWSMTRACLWQGNVLAGSEAGDVIAYRLSDGARQWSHRFKGVIRSIGGGSDDVLYIGTLSGMVYAFVER
jgi:outer membrane protein assembly factor BamB